MKVTPDFLKEGSEVLDALLSKLEEKPDPSVQESILGVAAGEAFHDAKQELLLFVIAKLLVRSAPAPDKVVDQYNDVLDQLVKKGLI